MLSFQPNQHPELGEAPSWVGRHLSGWFLKYDRTSLPYTSGQCLLETKLATAGSILRAPRSPLEKGKKPDDLERIRGHHAGICCTAMGCA